jgi:hypothetical protein
MNKSFPYKYGSILQEKKKIDNYLEDFLAYLLPPKQQEKNA